MILCPITFSKSGFFTFSHGIALMNIRLKYAILRTVQFLFYKLKCFHYLCFLEFEISRTKTGGQKISLKSHKTEIKICTNPRLALLCFEQPGSGLQTNSRTSSPGRVSLRLFFSSQVYKWAPVI